MNIENTIKKALEARGFTVEGLSNGGHMINIADRDEDMKRQAKEIAVREMKAMFGNIASTEDDIVVS